MGSRIAIHGLRAALLLVLGMLVLGSTPGAIGHNGLDEQIAAVSAKLENQATDPDLFLKRAELHRLHGDWACALADCNEARRFAKPAVEQFCRGKVLLDAQRFAEATNALNEFLTAYPTHSEAFFTRARAKANLKVYLEAVDDFSKAIRYAPAPQPDHYLERAQAWQGANEPGKTIDSLDEGIKRLGPLVSLHKAAIDYEVNLRRYDRALARIEILAGQTPRKESWLLQRGLILEKAGNPYGARQSFEQSLAAVQQLPARLQQTQAMRDLRSTVEAALQRLSVQATIK